MNAMLSVEMGEALVFDEGKPAWRVAMDDSEDSSPAVDALRWMSGLADVLFLEDCSVEQVRNRLLTEELRHQLFRLFVILFDASLSNQSRRMAAEEMEESFGQSQTSSELLGAKVYSQCLPSGADFDGVKHIVSQCSAPEVRKFIDDLRRRQSTVSDVSSAWRQAVSDLSPAETGRFYQIAVQEQLFFRLTLALENQSIGLFQVESLANAEVRRIPRNRELIQSWIGKARSVKGQSAEGDHQTPTRQWNIEADILPAAGKEGEFRRSIPLDALMEKKEKQKAAILAGTMQ